MAPENPSETETTSLELMISRHGADFFIFSGPMNYLNAKRFIDSVEQNKHHDKVVLILATYGGDAGAAYRIARFLKQTYQKFTLCVFGFCKSAGTLVALGADEIIMSKRAEFGPLDVQLIKADEFTEMSSGLDVSIALDEIGINAFGIFEKILLELKQRSGGAITTKTAAEVASNVAVGLLVPITGQIDPLRLGETRRAMKIAHQYGLQLGADEKVLKHLTEDYPTHDFVIDLDEAKSLFKCVRESDSLENKFERDLHTSLHTKADQEFLRLPSDTKLVMGPLKPKAKKEPSNENANQNPDVNPGIPTNGGQPADAHNGRVNGPAEGHNSSGNPQNKSETPTIEIGRI